MRTKIYSLLILAAFASAISFPSDTSPQGLAIPGPTATQPVSGTVGATQSGTWLAYCNRDDALSAVSGDEGDAHPCRVDANGAIWINLATALSSSVDSITTRENTGANDNAKINCTNNAFLNMTTATTAEIVALSGSTIIYVCSYSIISDGETATNVKFVDGTGTDCGTSQSDRSSSHRLTAATNTVGVARGSGEGMILRTSTAGDAFCVTSSGSANVGIDISFAQF